MSNHTEEYKQTIIEVIQLLDENKEWKSRYKDYITLLTAANRIIDQAADQFGRCKNLDIYSSVSRVKSATDKRCSFNLRYNGQSVAELIVDDKSKEITLKLPKSNASSYVNYPAQLRDVTKSIPWQKGIAKQFRKFFAGAPDTNPDAKNNKEHDMESQLLKQFSQKTSKDKYLLNIQPVQLLGLRFQMPTPLAACNAKKAKLNYSGCKGGGIDILARHGKGRGIQLTVIELKDECTNNEPPETAIRQAIAYATFLHALLRTEEADPAGWWRLFGYKGSVPKKLRIKAVIAMPSGEYNDTSFAGEELKFGDSKDVLELHYLYFGLDAARPKITGIVKTSLGDQNARK